MKEAFLKGYYGYKNFGDELLLFGVVKRIFSEYSQINHLVIEVNNKIRIEYRVKKNYHDYLSKEQYNRISFVEIKQHRRKRFTHALSMLGFAKYRNYFKFFGGGEVLSDERGFPHDGRNILLLFAPIIRKGKFILLGGIGTPKKKRTKLLYDLLLPRAQAIITRDATSYKTALKRNTSTTLYQDFSQETIQNTTCHQQAIEQSYVLINCNLKSRNQETKRKISEFCTRPMLSTKRSFFPVIWEMICIVSMISKKIFLI
jgi:polysaccharide pyruvyl transferase WcaK-like protein